MKWLCYIVFLFVLTHCRTKEKYVSLPTPSQISTPSSVKKEHEYLLDLIRQFSTEKDSAGRTANKILVTMEHHFSEEESYVLPPLGILPQLAKREVPAYSDSILALIKKFRTNSAHMIAEHQLINAYIEEWLNTDGANRQEILFFKNELEAHARLEEEVLFPAAILIGEYLQLKIASKK